MRSAGRLLERLSLPLERALEQGAAEAEVCAGYARSIEAWAQSNDLHRSSRTEEAAFGVRVLAPGGGVGFASTNAEDTQGLTDVADAAVVLSRSVPPDPLAGLPDPMPPAEVGGLEDPALIDFPLANAVERVARLLTRVRDLDPRVNVESAWVKVMCGRFAIRSSRGIALSKAGTYVQAGVMAFARDGERVGSFDYQVEDGRDLATLDRAEGDMTETLVRRALRSLDAGAGEAFRGPVILSPEAVEDILLHPLLYAVQADLVRKGKSRFAGRLGEEVASPLLTVTDDGCVPGGVGSSPFDREGIPSKPLTILDRGRLAAFLYNSYEAHAARTMSTGHARGGPTSLPGVGPTNVSLAAGDAVREEMDADTDRILYVVRFSGNVNPLTGEASGVAKTSVLTTREGGRRPVGETMIRGNAFDLLRSVSAVSRERAVLPGGVTLPWVRVEDVSVSVG